MMKKIIILTSCFICLACLFVNAQCSNHAHANPSAELFRQNPSAKAAMVAATDDSIEKRIHPKTGETYYIRHHLSAWSGELSYQIVVFDEELEAFVDWRDFAGQGGAQNTCPEKRDSTALPKDKILPGGVDPQHKPRRSSTVKLASNTH